MREIERYRATGAEYNVRVRVQLRSFQKEWMVGKLIKMMQDTLVIQILERNEYAFADLVSHTIPIDRVAEGFNALHSGYHLDDKDTIKIAVKGGLV